MRLTHILQIPEKTGGKKGDQNTRRTVPITFVQALLAGFRQRSSAKSFRTVGKETEMG
jgi:hypothetical protein